MISIVFHNHHEKFFRDSIRYEDERYLVETGGVFLGISSHTEKGLASSLIGEYEAKGTLFVRDLRGSFVLHIYDKAKDLHLVWTNHSGDKPIFYYQQEGNIIVSDSVRSIVSQLGEMNISTSLDRDAAYFLLTYGYYFANLTIVAEIRRLRPGEFLKISKDRLTVETYYRLSNTPDNKVSFQDALEQTDILFRQAISREFEKDAEYGYSSLSSLSGGLDSRMCTWVGHDMGFTNMTNLTFSKKGSADEIIAKQIVNKLEHPWIFLELDEAGFMMDVDAITAITEGTAAYLNLAHAKYAIDQVDFGEFGLLHTGQVGDVTIGSFCTSADYGKPAYARAASGRFLHKLPPGEPGQYENLELLFFYNRAFNSALSGHFSIQQYTEVASPFLDVDLLDFCLSLPLEYRINHRLYKEWIIQKYPEAAAFKWEKLGRKITEKTVNIRGKVVSVSRIPDFIIKGTRYQLDRLGNRHRGNKGGMNPFQYWYNTNETVHKFVEQYFDDHIASIDDNELREDCRILFSTGSIREKAQVMTLLSVIKQIWKQ